MSFRYIADTYAWVSYFNNKRFKEIIESEIIETPSLAIAELVKVLIKKQMNSKNIDVFLTFIMKRGLVLPLDFSSAKKGAEIAVSENLSLSDGIIYSYALDENSKLLTGDEHFKGKRNVIFEKE